MALSPPTSPGAHSSRLAWSPLQPQHSNRVHPIGAPRTPVVQIGAENDSYESNSGALPTVIFTQAPISPQDFYGQRSGDLLDDHQPGSRAESVFAKSLRAISALTEDEPDVIDKHAAQRPGWSSPGYEDAPRSVGRGSILRDSILLAEIRPSRLIAKQYGQGLMASVFTTALNVPMVYGLSRLPWHTVVNNPLPGQSKFELNTTTYELSLFFQTIFPLSLYSVVLYACIKSTWKLPRNLIISVGVLLSLSFTVAGLFYRFDVPFWFYSGDFIYIALSYVPAMCAVGWFLADEGSTNKERLKDLLMVAALETVVAAAAILYCMYLMPLFFMLQPWGQLSWVCILHPIYFEFTTAIMLRMVLRRNALKGRTNVQWFLSIIHAAVHSTSIASILTSSIDSFGISIFTQVICSACKLFWRSTTNLRDLWVERLGKQQLSFKYSFEEQLTQNRLVAVGIQTEMILENASNILAPWLIWCTWHEPLFMSVAPVQLVSGGSYPAYYVICLILSLVTVTAVFDLTFLWLNYHSWQQLPVIETWREIRKAGWWYFGFLTYALTFMGIMFLFITMIIVPRATFCKENNYCTCKLMSLQAVCDGEYVSTMGGNVF